MDASIGALFDARLVTAEAAVVAARELLPALADVDDVPRVVVEAPVEGEVAVAVEGAEPAEAEEAD